jgi:hypothetical protein
LLRNAPCSSQAVSGMIVVAERMVVRILKQ